MHSSRRSRTLKLAPLLLATVQVTSCTAGPVDVFENTLLRGLVAHWTFDEGAGTVVTDSSGNSHHGALTGGTWIAGHFGAALHLELGDQVAVPVFPHARAQWTVGLWVRPPAEELQPEYATLVSTEVVFSGGWEMNAFLFANDRRYQFGYYLGPGDSDYYTYNCQCTVPQQWTHILAVVDGAAGTLTFYRDGLRQPPGAPPPGATLGPIKPGSDTLFMGRWHREGRLFKGDLDDVVIYDRALDSSEVAELARNAAPVTQ